MKQKYNNLPLFIDYWMAVDTHDGLAQSQARQRILADLTPRLKAIAWCEGKIPEAEDLYMDLVVKVLEVLPNVPRDHPNPGGYLIVSAKRRALEHHRQNTQRKTWESSLDETLEYKDRAGYTLADVLPVPQALGADDDTLSPEVAQVLNRLTPQLQQLIQERYHFINWTPEPGQGVSPYFFGDALARLRQLCGLTKRP